MKKKHILFLSLGLVCSFLLGFGASFLAPKPGAAEPISWDTYNTQTDYLFQALSKETLTEPEGRIITGLIGIPWADGEDDSLGGDSWKNQKRLLQVCCEDGKIDAFVVAYYSPNVTGEGFAGVFRQYPSSANPKRMLSTSTTYFPGMIVSTYVFSKPDTEIDKDYIVKKDLALTASIQTILGTMP